MNDSANPCLEGSSTLDRSQSAIVDMMSAPQRLEAPCSARRVKAGGVFDGLVRQGLHSTTRSRMVLDPLARKLFEPYSDCYEHPGYVPVSRRTPGETGVWKSVRAISGTPSWPKDSRAVYVEQRTEVYTPAALSACLVKWGPELEKKGLITPELLDWLELGGDRVGRFGPGCAIYIR